MHKNKSGQSTLEYAVIIAVVVGALLAIQIYMRRGVEGKMRDSTDKIGEQYSAGNMQAKYTTTQTGDQVTTEKFGGQLGQGTSRYDVIQPADVKISATGADAEKVTKDLKDEVLFP
jgi:hypothetical protein